MQQIFWNVSIFTPAIGLLTQFNIVVLLAYGGWLVTQDRLALGTGLVVFAGRARILCPLTPDYDHFREVVATLDPADPQLAPVPGADAPASGTRIGQALLQAVQLHEPVRSVTQDDDRVTVRNLKVVKIDADKHLILVRGAVPGFNGSVVLIRPTNKR